jgi:hypothetical protein
MKALMLLFLAAVAVGYFVNTENKTAETIGAAPAIVEAFSKASEIKGQSPVIGHYR